MASILEGGVAVGVADLQRRPRREKRLRGGELAVEGAHVQWRHALGRNRRHIGFMSQQHRNHLSASLPLRRAVQRGPAVRVLDLHGAPPRK